MVRASLYLTSTKTTDPFPAFYGTSERPQQNWMFPSSISSADAVTLPPIYTCARVLVLRPSLDHALDYVMTLCYDLCYALDWGP